MTLSKRPVNRKKSVTRVSTRTHRRTEKDTFLAIIACILLPPLGIYMVWHRGFIRPVRYAMTGVAVLVLVGVVLMMPNGDRRVVGGIEMNGSQPEANIYGPDLPTSKIPGYTESAESVLVNETATPVEYYYASDGEQYFHKSTCKFAYASGHKITAYEAYYLGYEPCPICGPAAYVEGQNVQ